MDYTTDTMTREGEKYVLSIYPNQLGFGFSVMKNAYTLMEYQIVTARPMLNRRLMPRIREYIDYFEPDVVVLEDYKGKQSYKSKRVQKLIREIAKYARSKKVEVAYYSRGQIREVFSTFKARTKHEIASTIAQNIPKLKDRLRPKRLFYHAEQYSMGIFDSISLAVCHYYLTD